MENNYEITPLFPIPVYKTKIPEKFSRITSFFNNQKFKSGLPQEDQWGTYSINTYILDEPECKDLKNYILENLLIFSKNYLDISSKTFKITQSWISLKRPNQYHKPHSHSNSIISGVFYYGKHIPKTPSIEFHSPFEPRNCPGNNLLSTTFNNNSYNQYNVPIVPINTTPGDLILFPSWLLHSVPPNNTEFNRYSLAFNVVPAEGFGSKENLNELKFN